MQFGRKEVQIVTTDGAVLEGTITKQNIIDITAEQLLSNILTELKKMNLQLSLMTDTDIKDTEVN